MSNPNPSGCCGVDTDCCENKLPDVLKATLTNVMNCSALDGVEIPLYSDGERWKGQYTCGSYTVTLQFYCLDPMGFHLQYNLGCGIDATAAPPDSLTCDPLNAVFTALGIAFFPCDCCDEDMDVEVTVTVTE